MQVTTAGTPSRPSANGGSGSATGASIENLCRRLPPFPPLANQLIELFSSPNASLQEAETLIRSDAVFSGELLRLANSAEFTVRQSFEDVAAAIMYLGFERVRSVIRRVTYARLMKDQGQHPFSPEVHRANLASAYLCQKLYQAYSADDDADGFCPYSLGLYLKIGATALLRGYPKDYPRFLCSRLPAMPALLAEEKKRFGFDHVEVSAFLVRQWGFPESFAKLVEQHASPSEIQTPLSARSVASLACQLTGSLGFSFLKGHQFPPFEQLQDQLSGRPAVPLPQNADEWKQGILEHLEALQISR
jgi:HD-like signal output (HDOD) protein